MPELYSVRFVSTGTEQQDDFFMHYGIKGQKWGLRRYQNEDGTYTQEGLARLQNGMRQVRDVGTKVYGAYNTAKNTYSKVRTFAKNPKQAVSNMLNSSKKKSTPAQQKARKERAKKIMIAAGAVALTAAVAYGLHRYNKTSENLTQLARNKIAKEYEPALKKAKGEQLRNLMLQKQKEMYNVGFRTDAREKLGLRTRRQARQYIRDNKIYKMKLVDLVGERHSLNVIGAHKSRLTGKLRNLNKREVSKIRKKMAEGLKNI